MPFYNYTCSSCGDFQEIAPISQFVQPRECPACGLLSDRALTTPQVSNVSGLVRQAHTINERSKYAPKRAKANGLKPSGPRIGSRAKTNVDGTKSAISARPWMLSH